MTLWSSPIYRFRIPADNDSDLSDELIELTIDVTGSAPSQPEPSTELKATLDAILKSGKYNGIKNICEFGAGKLKNIPLILTYGKPVCAVEFEELMANEIAESNFKKCKKDKKFGKMLFPNPFIDSDIKYDLVLLLNVPPVMPIPAERMFLLDLLHKKIKEGKYLLWIAQKEDKRYRTIRENGKNQCGDGIWMGADRRIKTFYRYYPVDELTELMGLYGFSYEKRFHFGSSDVVLFKKNSNNLFGGLITTNRLLKEIPADDTIQKPDTIKPKRIDESEDKPIIIPNPDSLAIEGLYREKIEGIPRGDDPEVYHRVVSYALSRIFRGSLKNMEVEVEIVDGKKRIDTVFTNKAEHGFFKRLSGMYKCPYPIVEAKNYSGDPKAREFDQLNGRLGKNRGEFGILVCRGVKKEMEVMKLCRDYLTEQNHCILILTDEDIFELLDYSRMGSNEEIDDFMDKKMQKLLIR